MNLNKKLLYFGVSLIATLGLYIKGSGTSVSAVKNQIEPSATVTLVGSSCAGKTCAFNRIVGKEVGNEQATIGGEFQILEKEGHSLFLVSPSGLEKFRSIAINWLRRSDVAVLVFDISDSGTTSFDQRIDEANEWFRYINILNDDSGIKAFYWFNKIDEKNCMNDFDFVKYNLKYGENMEFGKNTFFISAKTGEGLNEAMDAVWNYTINKSGINYAQNEESDQGEEDVAKMIADNTTSKKACLLI